jgi:hypothetical protein
MGQSYSVTTTSFSQYFCIKDLEFPHISSNHLLFICLHSHSHGPLSGRGKQMVLTSLSGRHCVLCASCILSCESSLDL